MLCVDKGHLRLNPIFDDPNIHTDIDPATILMYKTGEEAGVAPIRWSYEDAATPYEDETPEDPDGHELTGDGVLDLVLKFDTPVLVSGLSLGDDVGDGAGH